MKEFSLAMSVSSPFILSVNEGQSEISLYSGDTTSYLPLLYIPTKPPAEGEQNLYVDLLVVVKSVKPVKTIKTKSGTEMLVRSIEVIDNTTPVSFVIDIFDLNDIQRAEKWIPLNSVLFIADARVCWRRRLPSLQLNARSVVTHQPHTGDAEALRLYAHSQAERRNFQCALRIKVYYVHQGGGEAAAWTEWSGECATTASVSQVRDRLAAGMPFCASLHALLSHLNLDELDRVSAVESQELHVRFSDHTGELSARLPVKTLEQIFGYPNGQLLSMNSEERSALRWRILLEQCHVRLAVSPTAGLLVLSLRKATPADPIPLY
ncbi:hypothetical protein EVAR_80582_1 [Eumeta japonica]|uniref:Uncharacterized protein n=1 Tax=Eumeta variegata TaxID=151549 RepID=A0A4C1TNG0_EUMVA|nr:hypothetical protein EVAR_80582_1 [Eumeta japonica]